MSKIKKVFYNYTFISFFHTLMIISGIVGVAILARFLGPQEYGRYNLFIFSSQLLTLLVSTWVLNPAAARFSSEEYLKDNSIRKTFSSEILIMLANAVIAGVVFYLIRGKVSVFLGFQDSFMAIFVFIYLLVCAFFNLIYFCFQGSLDFKAYGIMPLVRSLLFIFMLIAGIAVKGLFGFGFVIIVLIVSYLTSAVAFWPRLKSLCGFVYDKKQITAILAFSWPMILFSTGNFMLEWIDKYWIRMIVSVYAVGIYSAAWSLTTNFVLIPQQLYAIVLPLITAYRLEEKHDNIIFYLNKLVPQLAFFFSLLLSIVIIFSGIFIPILYGSKYFEAVNIFIILSLSSLFMGIKYFYNPVSTVFNFIRMTGSINISSAFLCALLNYLFIIRYGIVGAAIATTASSLIACIAVMFIINKQFKLYNFKAIYCSFPAVAVAVVCLLAKNILADILFSLAFYYITYLIMKKRSVFSSADLVYIQRIEMPAWLRSIVVKFYGSFS
ncbi:MAG: polysaccharide biosynthesis C-terminal domain-containing protein [Candidatus Omnitrophota bacterium]